MGKVVLDLTMSLDGFVAEPNPTPVLLGKGIRLFGHMGVEPIELENNGVIESSAVTDLKFWVIK